jgi:hypothetical protein
MIELLSFRVVGFHILVAERPGRRDTIVVTQFAEIFLALAIERCSVAFGRPTYEIVNLWLERPAIFIGPDIRRDIAILFEDRFGLPVLELPWEPVTTLKQQDAFP